MVEREFKDRRAVPAADGEGGGIWQFFFGNAAQHKFGVLDGAIRERGGRNPRAIKSLMDMDALRESDDQPGAVCAALEQLLTDEGYLFERATPIPTGGRRDIGGNAGVPPDGDGDARMRAVMGLPVERCG